MTEALRFRLPMKPVTVQDIAESLHISAMTVSRALRNHPEVSEETKRRVLLRAREMNYRPNRWARSLITRKSFIIGLVLPDISHTFFSDIAAGVQETIEESRYSLILCRSNRNAESEVREIDMLIRSRVDGLIVASEQPEDSPHLFAQLHRDTTPFVLIDRVFPKLNCHRVVTNDYEVGRLATQHLIDLGHRRIAHVRGPAMSTARQRQQAYQDTLTKASLPVRPEWIVDGNFQMEDSCEAAMQLMRLSSRPDAIFAASDLSAFGVVAGCRDWGLRVPEDVAVVGAGNIEGRQHPSPFLTTIDWDRRELGRQAARVLLHLIAGGKQKPRKETVFPPRLVVRQSSARRG
ncbi:MAG: LacI family DNA-binding transcriptional regulator [Bryobacteraceae bacterium]